MQGGILHGLSVDPMGISNSAIPAWEFRFTRQFNGFRNSIDRHFSKIYEPKPGKPPLDQVVIDFNHMDQISPTLKTEVMDYINSKYPEYNNDMYLIKLNF